MGRWYDARITPDGWRFRQWSSVVDAYVTEPMTEEETRKDMLDHYTALEVRTGVANVDASERIARAKTRGTTCKDYPPQDVNGPWEEERCDDCGSFHRDGDCADAKGVQHADDR